MKYSMSFPVTQLHYSYSSKQGSAGHCLLSVLQVGVSQPGNRFPLGLVPHFTDGITSDLC